MSKEMGKPAIKNTKNKHFVFTIIPSHLLNILLNITKNVLRPKPYPLYLMFEMRRFELPISVSLAILFYRLPYHHISSAEVIMRERISSGGNYKGEYLVLLNRKNDYDPINLKLFPYLMQFLLTFLVYQSQSHQLLN